MILHDRFKMVSEGFELDQLLYVSVHQHASSSSFFFFSTLFDEELKAAQLI